MLGNFCMLVCRLLIFLFKKKIWNYISSVYQTAWVLIRPDKMSDLICIQAVCKGYQQPMTGNYIYTVELWSLELACLEHQGSLEHVHRSRQFPFTFNVKIHLRLEQRWLELSNSKHGPQGDFSCKNAMMARTKYF